MFPNDNPRPLNYRLSHSDGLEVNTPISEEIGGAFIWDSGDNDEKITITMELSLNEYVALANCIDVGRDIAYGNASLNIWWVWVRSYVSMSFCDQLDNCVITNATTQTTINNMLQSSGIVNPDTIEPIAPQMDNRLPLAERNEEVNTPPTACDLDELWAGILEIVTRLNEIGLDFLQDIVAYNDKAERIANIIDIVPLFGDIAADVITVFSDVAPDLLNAYLAHSSQQVLEDTACALFELVCDECRYPTYQEIFDHYASAGISGIDDIANYGVTALMDFMIGSNNLANAVVWYTMNASVLYTLYLGGTFLNRRGLKWLSIWANIGEESPSNAWDILCDGCGETCITYDFLTSDGGFIPFVLIHNTAFGIWQNGVGWTSEVRNLSQYITVKLTGLGTQSATGITFIFTLDAGTQTPDESVRAEFWLGGTLQDAIGANVNHTTGMNTILWQGNMSYDEIRLIGAVFTPANTIIKSLEICH